MRVYVRFTTQLSTEGARHQLFGMGGASPYALCYVELYRNGGVTYWRLRYYLGSEFFISVSNPSPTPDTWYCLEILWNKGVRTEFWINGVSVASKDTIDGTGITGVQTGLRHMTADTQNLYVDCVVVADAYIGVEAGGEEYSRSASQSLTLSLAASKLFEVTRPVTQAIGLMLSGTKLFDITRLASQTIYFVLDMGRIAEYHVSVSQTVTATLNVQRLGEFLRTASQSIGLSLQAIAETIASYFRNVALTITTTLNANRLIEVTRQASQILNFLFNGERLIEVTRVASQTLNFVLQGFGSIVTEFERLATLALTFTHGIMGMYGAPVDYALVLACFAVVLAIVAIGWAATKKD